MNLAEIALRLRSRLRTLSFHPPVSCIYSPLEYAWDTYARYLRRYGRGRREVVLLGMNPGPWGMVQTGIPFGDVEMVRGWLDIEGNVGRPKSEHPRRPVKGFRCKRREISGRRLWGWARDTFVTPEAFFARFFVANYCPLCFFDNDGHNLTPERLSLPDRTRLVEACDEALLEMIRCLRPAYVVGIGRFAERRAVEVLAQMDVAVGMAPHPSGANPAANRGWGRQMNAALKRLGA